MDNTTSDGADPEIVRRLNSDQTRSSATKTPIPATCGALIVYAVTAEETFFDPHIFGGFDGLFDLFGFGRLEESNSAVTHANASR
jgi:hypothetical protein